MLDDPRLKLTIDDACSFLQATDRAYDVIISEPSNPWISGEAGLFTREFYERCRVRLRPDGLMVQWIHLYDNSQEALDVVVRTFSSLFPNVSVWQSEEVDLILIGSSRPWKPNLGALLARFDEPDIRTDLARIHLDRPVVLLGREIISESNARFLVAPAGPIQTGMKPVLEYLAQRAFFVHHDATEWLQLDENFSPRADTLLAEYLRSRSMTADDYRAFVEFYFAYHLPRLELLRSLCHRWTGEVSAQSDLLELLPRLPPLGAPEEVEALRLTALRENLIARADKNPALLRYYAKILLQVYRSQRSIFYLPPAVELQSMLNRLLTTDLANKQLYLLELAELAWDRGDANSCIRLSRDALDNADWVLLQNDANFSSSVARFVEALALSGRRNEAVEFCGRAHLAARRDPQLELICRKIVFADIDAPQ